jgi:hypothetical protein
MANNEITTATASGPATFQSRTAPLHVPCALFVPALTQTLIAAGDITKTHDVLLQRDSLFIIPRGPTPLARHIVASGERINGVYHIPLLMPTAAQVEHEVFNHSHAATINQLKRRFPQAMRQLRARLQHLIPTAPTAQHNDHAPCAPCHIGKQTRAPFHSQHRDGLAPLDVVSTDLAGPLPASSHGMKYLQVFVDRATKYAACTPLPCKSLAKEAIIHTMARWARQQAKPVARLHSDGARELSSRAVRSALEPHGTVLTQTPPHSSASNPDAERIIRTLFNATRAALAAAHLGASYWPYAAVDALQKYNCIPLSRSPTGLTPHELFHGQTPPLSHLLPFGQYGHVTNTQPTKSTLAPRAHLARYLHSSTSSVYTIMYVATGRIGTCRSQEFFPTVPPTPLSDAFEALHIHESPPRPPKTMCAARRLPDANQWAAAHDAEIRRHETELQTWRYEDPLPGDRPRPYVMTYKVKEDADRAYVKHKARCAIRGDLMEAGVEYDPLRTSSHTPSHTARRTILATAAAFGHVVETWDVPGAYPRALADPRYRQTMKPPPYSDGTLTAPGQICVMQRAMQGAPDAGHRWERYRNDTLLSWGWAALPSEASAFIIHSSDKLHTARLLADTDDFLVTSTSAIFLSDVRSAFERQWQITIQQLTPSSPIQHTGLRITRTPSGTITVTNPGAITRLLTAHGMQDCNAAPTPHLDGQDLSTCRPDEPHADQATFMSALGSCRFIADTTHPQIAYICGVLGRHMRQPAARHMDSLKRVLRYLRGVSTCGLTYQPSTTVPRTVAACDTDYAQCVDTRRSTTGIVISYGDSLVHWSSSRQPTMSQSSSEAEYVAAAHAARDITWFTRLLHDWALPRLPGPTTLQIDNKGAIDMAHANGPTKRTKHIDVKHHYIQQQVQASVLTLQQVPSAAQRADFLTKPLKRVLFLRACTSHNLTT